MIIAPSSNDILFLPDVGPPAKSIGGIGSLVSPLICPHNIVALDKKLWKRSMISLVGTSPHFSWFWGLDKTGKNISLANSSRCSNGDDPPISIATTVVGMFSGVNTHAFNFINNKTFPLASFDGITVSSFIVSGTTRHLWWSISQNWATISLYGSSSSISNRGGDDDSSGSSGGGNCGGDDDSSGSSDNDGGGIDYSSIIISSSNSGSSSISSAYRTSSVNNNLSSLAPASFGKPIILILE